MDNKVKITVIPNTKDILFEERETNITHTPFELEYALFQLIKEGDAKNLKFKFNEYLSNEVIMGNMSRNKLKQIQYWAISTIAVAIHYAILGGLDETDAFNISDQCIRYVDSCFNIPDIISYLQIKAEKLTLQVSEAKKSKITSSIIRKAMHYIHINLHQKITLKTLAEFLSLSPNYFSTLFKKEIGMTLHRYILKEKLKTSKKLLKEGMTYSEISYSLGFCTESHFISWFHKIYGETPKEYLNSK